MIRVSTLALCLAVSGAAFAQIECGPEPAPEAPTTPETTPEAPGDHPPALQPFVWAWGPISLECRWRTIEPATYACTDPFGESLICSSVGQCWPAESIEDARRLRERFGVDEK